MVNLSHLITCEDVTTAHSGIQGGFGLAEGVVSGLCDELRGKGVSVDEEIICVIARKEGLTDIIQVSFASCLSLLPLMITSEHG